MAYQDRLPETVLYYRDGVSDGQFKPVLTMELNQLAEASGRPQPLPGPRGLCGSRSSSSLINECGPLVSVSSFPGRLRWNKCDGTRAWPQCTVFAALAVAEQRHAPSTCASKIGRQVNRSRSKSSSSIINECGPPEQVSGEALVCHLQAGDHHSGRKTMEHAIGQ